MKTYNYTQFVETFIPVVNPKFPQGPYEGTLFYKGDPGFIASNLYIKRVWSLLEYTVILSDVNSTPITKRKLVTGMVSDPGLIGYLVTTNPYEVSATEVINVPIP